MGEFTFDAGVEPGWSLSASGYISSTCILFLNFSRAHQLFNLNVIACLHASWGKSMSQPQQVHSKKHLGLTCHLFNLNCTASLVHIESRNLLKSWFMQFLYLACLFELSFAASISSVCIIFLSFKCQLCSFNIIWPQASWSEAMSQPQQVHSKTTLDMSPVQLELHRVTCLHSKL